MRLSCLLAVLTICCLPSAAYSGNGLDAALAAENKELGVNRSPVSAVSDLGYLRRVYVDLIGRIPTNAEIQAYENLPAASRRTQIVDQLLKHPRFADRWTIFLGDMLRLRYNAEGGAALTAYVHKAVSDGMPYDELARRLIATNGRAGQTPEVGFVLGDNADPMALAGVTSQTFLGVRIACAQCHDHPFDKWTRKDFYEFAAFFGKTRRVQRRFNNRLLGTYATEVQQTSVLWPPEGVADDKDRKPIPPRFPLPLLEQDRPSKPRARLVALRAKKKVAVARTTKKKPSGPSVDDLLATADKKAKRAVDGGPLDDLGVGGELKRDTQKIDLKQTGYASSDFRKRLASMITDPRNRYFSRSFSNRVWTELIGKGIVDPIDDFSNQNPPSHPETLDYLADEFVAGGFDLRKLVRLIVTSDVYQRQNAVNVADTDRVELEKAFLAAPMRRMIGETLYDSIVVAGHLFDVKHEAGKNLKTVWRQTRIMKKPAENTPVKPQSLASAGKPAMTKPAIGDKPKSGYDLEAAIELDFGKVLKKQQMGVMIDRMQVKSKEELEAERMQAEMRRQQAEYFDRFIRAVVDDNPKFTSAARMPAPAPPEHFLRVFGQPGRQELGDFRDDSSSMRQALMMLNGRLTNEASRVGELEPIHALLVGKKADVKQAVRLAYREILTREPSSAEMGDAADVISAAITPTAGMADLRWVLLNSNEFRFLP